MSESLSGLQVQGDPNAVDSFAAFVRVIAGHFGRTASYEYVEALTGTCFSPCHNKGEDCIGWMMDGGNAFRVDFIAEALGLHVEKVELEGGVPEDWFEVYKNEGTLPWQIDAYFGKLQQAQAWDEIVVLATWPAWSVLTGWADDLNQLPFATTPGFEPVVGSIWPPIRTRLAFVFKPGGDLLPREDIVISALHFGAQIASGSVSPRVSGFDAENEYGGALYDVMIDRTSQETLCPGCQEDGCFGRTAKRLHDGHKASLMFLQEAAGMLDGHCNSVLLDKLQRYYADMQAISGQYLDWHARQESWNTAEVRSRMRADFEQMKSLHKQAAYQFHEIAAVI